MKVNYLKVKILVLIVITLFFFTGFRAYSQNDSNKGSYLSFANPISAFYVGGWSSGKNNQQLSIEMKNTYRIADSILNISPVPFLRMKYPDREGVELVFVQKPNGRIRVFQSLIDKGNYLILCSRGVEERCDCRNNASLYIYLPGQNLLKMVEKAFSLSIKRNLISDLNKYVELNLSEEEFENTCDVLNTIEGSQ